MVLVFIADQRKSKKRKRPEEEPAPSPVVPVKKQKDSAAFGENGPTGGIYYAN